MIPGLLPDGNGLSPIHYAAKKGHVKAVELFVEKFKNNPNTIRIAAPRTFRNERLRHQDSDCFTPIDLAAKYGHKELVNFLMKFPRVFINGIGMIIHKMSII